MRKKYEKVVLKSDIFKSTTPQKTSQKSPQKSVNSFSRSPISKNSYLNKKEEEKVDPNDLFQKVCCPNCRFIFKIIKNNQILANKNFNSQSGDRVMRDYMTQTEQLKREVEAIKNIGIQMKQMTQNKEPITTKSSVFKYEMEQISQSPAQTDRIHNDSYRIQSAYVSSKRATPKSNIKSPLMKINERSNAKSIKRQQKKSETSSQVLDNKSIFSKERDKQIFDIQKFNNMKGQLKQLLIKLYDRNHQNEEIICLLKELPADLQIPSYQKMLLCESNAKVIEHVSTLTT